MMRKASEITPSLRAASPEEASTRLACACGFAAVLIWMQVYASTALAADIGLHNFALYAVIAHAATLALDIAPAPARLHRAFGSAAAPVCLASGALFTLNAALPSPGSAAAASAAFGVASALLATRWLESLAALPVRSLFAAALLALVASQAVQVTAGASSGAVATACLIALPVASCALLARAPRGEVAERRVGMQVPWPFLVILGLCCMIAGFFAGITLSPYAVQSNTVTTYQAVAATAAAAVLLAVLALSRKPNLQVFFLLAFACLFAGLSLFSSGVLGSILPPLGFSLAAEACCSTLAFVTLGIVARYPVAHARQIIAGGLIVCDGMLARGIGMLASMHTTLGYLDVAAAASALTATLGIAYAAATVLFPKMNSTLAMLAHDAEIAGANVVRFQPGRGSDSAAALDGAKTAEAVRSSVLESTSTVGLLERLGLTDRELTVAYAILEGETYRAIGEKMGVTERTVKYHAGNIFKKAGVRTRHEFEIAMTSQGDFEP